LISGAAPLSAELVNQLMKVIPNAQIGQGYGRSATSCSLDADIHRAWNSGLTESATSLSMYPVDQKIGIPGSAGQLLPGVVARVVKPDGSLAGFNEPGELRVKTPSLALGYWNDERATKETFVEGWLCTGDEVIIREDKEIFIIDRLKVFCSKSLLQWLICLSGNDESQRIPSSSCRARRLYLRSP
jgi:4-coumarate--CoA ligase